jgi:hypothetical protein
MKKKTLQMKKPRSQPRALPVPAVPNKLRTISPAEVPTSSAEHIAKTQELLRTLTGVGGTKVANRITSQMKAMQIWGAGSPDNEMLLTAVEMLAELQPANAMEALLAVQMFGVHEAALLFLKRATCEGQTFDGTDANVVRATKLLRLFTEKLEAMAKLKGKAGQQKVTVEHVHVYQGGQAIVGAMGTPGKGGEQ